MSNNESIIKPGRLQSVPYPKHIKNTHADARDYWYLRDTEIIENDCYADDFGYQWNELAGNYLDLGNIHLSQLARVGIPVSQIKDSLILDAGLVAEDLVTL